LTPFGHCPADGLLAHLPATWFYGDGRGKLSRTYPAGGSLGHGARRTTAHSHPGGRCGRLQQAGGCRRPGRNELPAHRHCKQPIVARYDRLDRICRAGVVIRPEIARRLREPVESAKLFCVVCWTSAQQNGPRTDQAFAFSARRMSSFDGNFGSTSFRACSTPVMGNFVGSNIPICANRDPWSQ
jgi:hypothetical protein